MKDNKLIAEFMELEVEDGLYYYTTLMDDYKTDTLYFDSSWDWLMPVVAKISRDEKYFEEEYREYLLDVVPYGHIEDVYDAVINFIKHEHKLEQI
tara:strand:+ start:756 stop:1040 length:285 start_codon:yes stop_codon:yes gene_type:complete